MPGHVFDKNFAENDAERWLLALGAMYKGMEKESVQLASVPELYLQISRDAPGASKGFFGKLFGGTMRAQSARALKNFWDVGDEASTLSTLGWLLREGHATAYNYLIGLLIQTGAIGKRGERLIDNSDSLQKLLESLSEKAAPIVEHPKKLLFVYENAERLAPSGILAWDLARAVNVLEQAVEASYLLNSEIVWGHLKLIGMLAHHAFGSWQAYADSYLAGLRFWDILSKDRTYFEICRRLLAHPQSPWNVFRWDTPLPTKAWTEELRSNPVLQPYVASHSSS